MVEVIYTEEADHTSSENYGGGRPIIHIHNIERKVHGNGIDIKVYGEMKIAAGERVWAKEMKLKTIEVMSLTPEVPHFLGEGLIANKHIHHKGEYGNYASIDIYDDGGTYQSAGEGPSDGSVWLDFITEGA